MVKGKEIIISSYNNKAAKTNVEITLLEELNYIIKGRCKTQVEHCRRLYTAGLIAEYKMAKSVLPVVTFSGTFNGAHTADNLSDYSKLFVIDIDNIEEVELKEKKETIFDDKHVLAIWISPSNRGLKILISTESTADAHKTYYSEICNYLSSTYNILIDKSGSDICRLCFTSYDPETLFKDECEPFVVDLEVITEKLTATKTPKDSIKRITTLDRKLEKRLFYATEGKNLRNDRDTIDKIIRFLRSRKLSITDNYNDWYKIGLAIANTFTYDLGVKYYLYLCEMDGINHDEYKSAGILDYCYRNRKLNVVNFATIIFLAEQKGFAIKKV